MRYSVRMVLWIGFGLATGLFLAASVVTVRSVGHILAIEQNVARLDHAKHHGHLTLADIQELYIHQAHTIILGNKSHLGHYNKAHQAAETRIAQLDAACSTIGTTNGVAEIRDTLQNMDQYFRETVLQGIEASSSEDKHDYHNQLETFANSLRTQILELNTVLDQKSLEARDNHEKFLTHTRKVTIVALFAGLIVAIVSVLSVTRMISAPIGRLREAFGVIGSGDMVSRVSPKGPRELKELAVGFNMMADEIVDSHRKVAAKERMAAIGEIAAGVAHELNNPLGVITGYLKLVRKNSAGEQAEKDLAVIGDEITNCKDIVRGLLDLARPVKLAKQQLNLVSVAEEVAERFNKSMPETSTRIDMQSSGSEISVFADESAIKQVLNNLLRNAVEAAGENGSVNILIRSNADLASIAVSDSGAGIQPAFMEDLFKPFKTTKEKGVGLGLAISLAIVRNHGGDIEAGCGPLGGARFTITLPINDVFKDRELEI